MILIFWLCKNWRPSTVSRVFGRLQIISAGAMAFSHGTGDAQKAMGIITGALYVYQAKSGEMVVPWWVTVLCAISMAMGTAIGGWAVMKTLGMKLANLKPYNGFSAEAG